MHIITKEFTFDMGHRVPNHSSKCKNPHGHTYRVQVNLTGKLIALEGNSSEGMVLDFTDLKNISKGFIDEVLDHGFMFYEKDALMADFFHEHSFKAISVDFIPTAENIAKWIYEMLGPKFKDKYGTGLHIHSIKMWETPTSFVEYRGPESDLFRKIELTEEGKDDFRKSWATARDREILSIN